MTDLDPGDRTTDDSSGGDAVVSDLRRHDLDALRAFAMLLGILLHAALAFVPEMPWMVKDSQPDPKMGILVSAIHGFRMPLFFLISGFFTAMLWRRRGFRALLWHRTRRIFFPMLLGLITIVPAMNAAGRFASRRQVSLESGKQGLAGVYQAAHRGDLEPIERAIAENADLDQPGGRFRCTPLTIASWQGHIDLIDALLDSGVDPNQKNADGNLALHGASFLGQVDAVKRLVQAGADPEIRNQDGRRPRDVLWTDIATTRMIAALIEVPVDIGELVDGRVAVMEILGGDAGALESVLENQIEDANNVAPDAHGNHASQDDKVRKWIESVIGRGLYSPVFGHLWFLYFLCWLLFAFAYYVGFMNLFGIRSFPAWLVSRPFALLYLIPLTLLAQYWMTPTGETFGPLTSLGWIPMPSVLAYYAIFFFFGAVTYDRRCSGGMTATGTKVLGRRSVVRRGILACFGIIVSAYVLYPFAAMRVDEIENFASVGEFTAISIKLTCVVGYAWAMSFAMLDAFSVLLVREVRWVRWVSDSSYWLYLAHLPLLVVLQTYLLPWQATAKFKWWVTCAIASALLLISYRYLIRYTWIGRLLNGPRTRRGASSLILKSDA